MGQVTAGVRSVLSNPAIYDLTQSLFGADAIRRELVSEHIRPKNGFRVLDIGCGTARIIDYLPGDVVYYGFDSSADYIDSAKRRYESRGEFQCALVEEAFLQNEAPYDVVLAIGVLHHLDDGSAAQLLRLARMALKEGGRLVTIDPCFHSPQNPVARFLVSRDRGQNVRQGGQYRELALDAFNTVNGVVKHRKWIPYTHWVMECTK